MDRRKAITASVKSIGPESDRVLRFIGSTETADRDGDIVSINGWKLDNFLKNPVIMYGHDYSGLPVGRAKTVSVDRQNKALIFDVQFPTVAEMSSDPDNASPEAKFVDTVYNMAKNGFLNATSVGFRALKAKTRDDKDAMEKPEWQRGYLIEEQELFELSIVPIPANPEALQMAKSISVEAADTMALIAKCGVVEDAIREAKSGRRISAASRAKIEAALAVLRELMGDDEMPEDEEDGCTEPKAASFEITKENFADIRIRDVIASLR